jgi:phosphotriesterase-related protein
MTNISRRQFLAMLGAAPVVGSIIPADAPYTYSVKGKLPVSEMGTTLIHEHVLVDFVGADNISPGSLETR